MVNNGDYVVLMNLVILILLADTNEDEEHDDKKLYIIVKDKATRWNLQPLCSRVRRPIKNMVVGQPGYEM